MTTKHDKLMLDPEYRKLYAIEGLLVDAAQVISDLLERRNLKQADLARMLNKTPAFVSQLLNGKANMTVRTLAEVAFALKASVKIEAIEESNVACGDSNGTKIHIPAIRMRSQESKPTFLWNVSGEAQTSPQESDFRSEYVA